MTDVQDRTLQAITEKLLDVQEKTIEALTTALLDAQEQHRQDAATIDFLISIKPLGDDDPKVGGEDE